MFEDRRALTWFGAVGLSALYLVTYVLLESASYLHTVEHTEISPWSPSVAFMVVVVAYFGSRVMPLAIVAPAIAEYALRGGPLLSATVLGAMVSVGCTYSVAGLLLHRMLRSNRQITIGWFTRLLGIIAVSALVDAMLYSTILIGTGTLTAGSYLTAVRTDWVGDVNGIIILVPLVLILRFGEPGNLREARAHPGLFALQIAALVFVFLVTFPEAWGAPIDDTRTPFYLLFLPIVWIALRWGGGVTAIALAVLQVSIVLFVAPQNNAESFLAIQVLMVLLACTGLFMGISVSETAHVSLLMRSKDVELSNLNARMAVSEMNSAIGHELNNPLAALVNYLRSATLMLESSHLDRTSLQSTLEKAHGEATRSVNVVRKLREFFRSGVVRPELLDAKTLAAEALAGMQVRFRQANITAVLETPREATPIESDPLQLTMVLQNLLANAYDAIHAAGHARGKVTVCVRRMGDDVQFSVSDSGAGIPESLRDQLFRAVSSTKAAGMGLGLAICRSLVEANDGRIWLERSGSDGTSIAFSIPMTRAGAEELRP